MITAQEKPFSQVLPWVLFTSFIFLVTYQVRAIFGPLLPYIEEEFLLSHAEATRYQLYISLGYAVSMFGTIYTSTVVKNRIMAGLSAVGTGLVLLVLAATPGRPALALCCVALGIATGQYFNAGMGTIRGLVSYKQWSRAVAIHEFGPNLSFLLCPLMAVVGAQYLGWRGVLAVLGVVAMLGGAAYMVWCKGGEETSPPFLFKGVKQVLGSPLFWMFVWYMGIVIGGQFGPFSVLVLHLIEECGFTEQAASVLLSGSRIFAPLAVLVGGWLTFRLGTMKALAGCLLLHSLSLFCLALPSIPLKTCGMFIQPMMAAMTAPPVFTLLAERFAARKQATVLAMGMPLASFAGTGAVPWLLGLCGTHASFSLGFTAMGVVVGLSLPLLLIVRKRRSRA